LFLHANFREIAGCDMSVGTGMRTPGSVGANNATKPLVRGAKALKDPVKRQKFQIVLMRHNAKVRRAGQREVLRLTIGNEDF
jgi:hypothetical protein